MRRLAFAILVLVLAACVSPGAPAPATSIPGNAPPAVQSSPLPEATGIATLPPEQVLTPTTPVQQPNPPATQVTPAQPAVPDVSARDVSPEPDMPVAGVTVVVPGTPVAGATMEPTGPGLVLTGCVRRADGSPVAGASIYRAYASYSGEVMAQSGADGCYRSPFQPIPGDEMVRVWAELDGKKLTPASVGTILEGTTYYWRHYYGFETATLDFTAP